MSARSVRWGPGLGVRWWRIAAGVSCGLAVAVKWNALYFVAALGLLTVLWDLTARRAAGVRLWLPSGLLRDGIPAFLSMIPVALVVYLSTWTGWFRSTGGYRRQWAAEHPEALAAFVELRATLQALPAPNLPTAQPAPSSPRSPIRASRSSRPGAPTR